jgi:hypothetical protein
MKNNMLTFTKAEITAGIFSAWWGYYLKLPCYQTIFPASVASIKGIKYMLDHQKSRNNIFTFMRYLKEYATKKDFKISGLIFALGEFITWVTDNNINISNTWYMLPIVSAIPLDILIKYFRVVAVTTWACFRPRDARLAGSEESAT